VEQVILTVLVVDQQAIIGKNRKQWEKSYNAVGDERQVTGYSIVTGKKT
jgi:hypothetical protein